MTRILAIEGTDIRKEIDGCEGCPLHWWNEAPDEDGCGLTGEYARKWMGREADCYEEKELTCPLPEKVEDPREGEFERIRMNTKDPVKRMVIFTDDGCLVYDRVPKHVWAYQMPHLLTDEERKLVKE